MATGKKKEVAHLILTMGFGGAERLVHDLAVDRVRRNGRASIVCLDGVNDNLEQLAEYCVPVHLIKRRPMVFDPQVVKGLCRYIRRHRIDLLHAHDLSSVVYASVAGWICRIPVMMTEHSRHYLEESMLRRFEKRVAAFGLEALVDVSRQLTEASRARDYIPERLLHTIPNGVSVESFQQASGTTFRAELQLPDTAKLIGAVGRLEAIKGSDVLLEAFTAVRRQRPEAHLVYVGAGSMHAALEQQVQALALTDAVHFAGVRSDIPAVMAGLDIFVMPSRSEGLPFALLEAMAAGCPVVSTQVGHIPDVINNGDNGYLVMPEAPDALSERLVGLLGHPEHAAEIAASGTAFVEENYSQHVMFEKYTALYEQLWQKRTGKGQH